MFSPLILISASLARTSGAVVVLGNGLPAVIELARRARATRDGARVIVATTNAKVDDALASLLRENDVPVYRGHEVDVLDRTLRASELFGAETILLVSDELPLATTRDFDGLMDEWSSDLDCLRRERWGCATLEMISSDALVAAWQGADHEDDRRSATRFICTRPTRFRVRDLGSDLRRPIVTPLRAT